MKPLENDMAKYNNFFLKEERVFNNEAFNICDIVKLVFDDIYTKYKDRCYLKPDNFTDHPILESLFLEKPLESKSKDTKTCDDCFLEYLNFTKKQTNKTYYTLLLKFAILMRECLNISRHKDLEQDACNREYTSLKSAETVPDICNEFVTEFLENNNYFGIFSDNDRNEIIELIQHFCTWLYTNGYTPSRLSLVS
jgi:hypothetical protein